MGMAGWTYCVTCTRDPFLLGVYPMAGQQGRQVEVQPVGFNLGGMKQAPVQVPQMEPGRMDLPLKVGAADDQPGPVPGERRAAVPGAGREQHLREGDAGGDPGRLQRPHRGGERPGLLPL